MSIAQRNNYCNLGRDGTDVVLIYLSFFYIYRFHNILLQNCIFFFCCIIEEYPTLGHDIYASVTNCIFPIGFRNSLFRCGVRERKAEERRDQKWIG